MAIDRRGQVWLVDLGFAAKTRPAVVMSIEPLDDERALVTLVPHTTSPRTTRFEVASSEKFLKPGVFDAQNLVTVSNADGEDGGAMKASRKRERPEFSR